MAKTKPDYDGVIFEQSMALSLSESGLALKVRCAEWDEDRWIPLSCIHDDSDVYKENTVGNLVLKLWWAEKEGLV